MNFYTKSTSGIAILSIMVGMSFCVPTQSQTQQEIDQASALLKRPQTKSGTLSFWAGIYFGKGDYVKAAEYYEKLGALYELDNGPISPKLAWASAKEAECQKLLKHDDKCKALVAKTQTIIGAWKENIPKGYEPYIQEAKKILDSLGTTKQPLSKEDKLRTAPWVVQFHLGAEALRTGNKAEAESCLVKALELCTGEENVQFRALLMPKLGDVYLGNGKIDLAEKMYVQVLELSKSKPKEISPMDVVAAEQGLGAVQFERGDSEKAEKILLNADKHCRTLEPKQKEFRATWLVAMIQIHSTLGRVYTKTKQSQKADAEKKVISEWANEHEQVMRTLKSN